MLAESIQTKLRKDNVMKLLLNYDIECILFTYTFKNI